MKLKIEVTAEHIREGTPSDTSSCAVALAIKQALPKVYEVEVDDMISFKDEEGYRNTAELSDEVKKFMDRFDNNEPVEPISFETDAYTREP